MRLWLTALVALLLPAVVVSAEEPFPGDAPVTLFFRETLQDQVAREPDTEVADESYIVVTQRSFTIGGTAPLEGFNVSELTADSPYSIVIGDFDSGLLMGIEGQLDDDPLYDPDNPEILSVVVPILALNYDGEEVEVGKISLNWNPARGARVEFSVHIDNVGNLQTEIESGVAADFYREQDEIIDAEDLTAAFTFGPFSYNARTVYTVGEATTASDDRVTDILSDVRIFGGIDSIPPTITISAPAAGDSSGDGKVTVFGTVQDKRAVKLATSTAFFAGEVASVEVKVGAADFVEADLTGTDWKLVDAPLEPGSNKIVVRATDVHGNVSTTPERTIKYLLKGTVTVEAKASGFPAGASGPAGTVKGAFLPDAVTAEINGSIGTSTATNIESGQNFTVTATAEPGAVFNGWTATLDGFPYFTALTERLTFETKANLVLTAEFVPNPFDPIVGTYHGLVTGDTAAERGTVSIAISKTGAFTGKLTAGALTLPIRGKVAGSGRWEGIVKKGAAQYAVAFTMNVSGTGDRDLAGTLDGNGLSANFTGDLNDWRKPRGSDPGNLATEYAGSYNVLLTPPIDSSVPAGTGFGRVTITTLGGVRLVGKLGDSSDVAAGATLVKRLSGGVSFPLFISLDKKRGSISGSVTYLVAPASDLTATLDWSEPATRGIEAQAFATRVTLSGSRYHAPPAGGFAILADADANGKAEGHIELTLPAYSLPLVPAGQALQVRGDATLDSATHTVALESSASTGAIALKMKIATKTGLFTGSFKDPQLEKTIPFAGAVSQKPNGGLGVGGGVFARGNRAGAIFFGPPPPP